MSLNVNQLFNDLEDAYYHKGATDAEREGYSAALNDVRDTVERLAAERTFWCTFVHQHSTNKSRREFVVRAAHEVAAHEKVRASHYGQVHLTDYVFLSAQDVTDDDVIKVSR